MKNISKLFSFALLVSFAQVALASADPCGVVIDLKGNIDKIEQAEALAELARAAAQLKMIQKLRKIKG